MTLRPDVWIILPAYNEASIIRSVVDSLSPYGYSVVVVDDCSTDGTVQKLNGSRAHVVSHAVNLGQGASLQTGIHYALQHGAAFLVTFDADGQHFPEEVEKLVAPLEHAGYDVALGTRFAGEETTAINMPGSRRIILKFATALTRLMTGLRLTDTHNGFRAFTSAAARKLNLTQNRMAHASQILAQVGAHRMKYIEVPAKVQYTEYSLSKGQKLSNAFNILWESITGKITS